MDVTLVLTHRCNLACEYCCAGEHHKTDIDVGVLRRGVDLLYADGADSAVLGFFGGEPLLNFAAMRQAVDRARALAQRRERRLFVVCTTNATLVRDEHIELFESVDAEVTVSIDGVREAHDLNRPRAGGGSSFDQVRAGLRRLLDAGVRTGALMVITPQTIPYVYRSIAWLWDEGVEQVRANLELSGRWGRAERDELAEQLEAAGSEQRARRDAGERAELVSFRRGIGGRRPRRQRNQVVVGTSGNLYPCSLMVGEDRDAGPETALRIGHLRDGRQAAVQSARERGVRCAEGRCACAAYMETGDRDVAGPTHLWFRQACAEIGAVVWAPHHQRRPLRRIGIAGVLVAASGVAIAMAARVDVIGDLGEQIAVAKQGADVAGLGYRDNDLE